MDHQQTSPRGLAAVLRTPQGAALAAVLTAAIIYLLVITPRTFWACCPLRSCCCAR